MPMHNPAHPGRILAQLMQDRTVTAVAKHLCVTRAALSRVLNGKAGISPEMAMKLQDAFGLEAEVWLRMQAKRDLWVLSQKKRKKLESLLLDKAA